MQSQPAKSVRLARHRVAGAGAVAAVAVAVAVAVVILVSACTAGPQPTPPSATSATAGSPAQTSQPGTAQPGTPMTAADIPSIVENVQPSVVTVLTDDGVGSGVVFAADGLILTNEHVVRGNTDVEVAFADGQRVAGTVKAADAISDLALVEAKRTGLPAARFQTDLPRVGELAIVIGSPLGFENTATAGIISGLHREIPGSAASSQSLVDLIQTDAAISPGNSGGAVVNSRGEVIGISEAYIPPQSGAVALGFAIPAATAVRVAEQLREDGTADHAFIGLRPGRITTQIAEQLGLQDTRGALVLSVVDGGPADDAGLRPGDVLIALDGKELSSPEDLLAELRGKTPDQTVNVGYRRGTESAETKVTLAARPAAEG
ncbi:trypsin-like peptidase domain-containing protein [Arthrobacter oryzae]|uniref:S1C family serine protease n=1 Tax=Arthrobacter oryzae TaxID=409290 RepID=UPI002866ACE1|nr:trypsin-like peptidase domain-containing protein [Arthrobacter oryzae]MDR6504811.1 S1-C subfamily serine protease [Arthrobacter oryzae]